MVSGGRSRLPYVGRHSLRPGDGAESPRQGQALHDLVPDQRLLAASSQVHCPVFSQTGGTHKSELGAERESLRRHHGGIVRAKIHESGKLTRLAPRGTEDCPGFGGRGGPLSDVRTCGVDRYLGIAVAPFTAPVAHSPFPGFNC